MTLPLVAVALLASLGVLVALPAQHAPRLLRHGTLPPRPRRVWLTLLVAREIGTAGAATAAAWLALAAPRPLPAWAAAALAGAAAFLVAEGLAPALGLLLPDASADRVAELASRLLGVLRRPLERPAVVLASWLAGEGGLAPASVLRFVADGQVEEGEEEALDGRGRQLLARVRALGQRPVRAVMTPRVRVVALRSTSAARRSSPRCASSAS